jgi:uncharacterized metal-binding protein YceD (DUF177 family)
MEEEFKIYVDQLRDGHEKQIRESLDPAFLDVHEPDLEFEKNIELEGVAYTAEDELILHWNIKAEALVPCSICNEKVPVEIDIDSFYHSEPVAEIKGAVFNYKNLLRETILLEVPPFAECNGGNCPKRKDVAKYLKTSLDNQTDEDEGYRPFADLDWKP